MRYRFDSYDLDTGRRELSRDGAPVAVEPQVFDLLVLLLRHRDRVVDRDEMLRAVWNGRIVSEATLASRINAARVAVGDSGATQRLIRTLPRKGFRFVGAVAEHAAPPATAPPVAGLPAVAVLPFANMSGDPSQDAFADGMAEEIITALSHGAGALVIARNSSFMYRGQAIDVRRVGQELGVAYVLEGSVRRAGDRLRVTGRLADAGTGAQLWAERFDGSAADVFALQDLVAARVAAALEPTVQRAEIARARPGRLDVYDLLLRATGHAHELSPDGLTAALDALDHALTIDPGYAPALALAAYCQAQRHVQGWTHPGEAARAEAVRRAWDAIRLAPQDAQVLWRSAFAIWNLADPTSRGPARDVFARAVQINPNSAMGLALAGWVEAMCGNVAAGRAMIEKALRLNPRDPYGWPQSGAMAVASLAGREWEDALTWANAALAQNRRYAVALRVLVVALDRLGRGAEAAHAVRLLLDVEPGFTIAGFFARIPVPDAAVAQTYAEALRRAGVPG